MRIGFFTDTHLGATLYRGARGWRTKEADISDIRRGDVYGSFNAALEVFLKERPDIVVHLGDLLEGRASATIFNDLTSVMNGIRTLLDTGIRVILLEGNHDFRRYADSKDQPFTVIETALSDYLNRGSLVIVRAGEYRIVEGWARVPIVAVGYHDEGDNFRGLSGTLRRAAGELNGKRAVLLLHQTVGDVWGIPEFYRIEDIPDNFVYTFNGHIHKRKLVVRPPRIFVNPGSVEYQDMGEAWDVLELLHLYDYLERTYGHDKALEMFKRVVMKGVVFLDLNAPRIRNLIDPEDVDPEGDEFPTYYWNSSRPPVFYHPLPTSRPFLKAEVQQQGVGNFRGALDRLLTIFNGLGVKAPVLSVVARMDEGSLSNLQAYLLGLLDAGKLSALRVLYESPVEFEQEEETDHEDKYAVFGKYAPVLRTVDGDIDEILDRKAQKEEAKRGEKKKLDDEIEKLKERVKEKILSALKEESYTEGGEPC